VPEIDWLRVLVWGGSIAVGIWFWYCVAHTLMNL